MNLFVIMQFDKEMNSVYRELIKGPLELEGLTVSRSDNPSADSIVQENLLDRIVQNLWDADYIVADLTRCNPNVYYELGIAHTLNKRTIRVSQDVSNIPFDIRPYVVLSYEVHEAGASYSSDLASTILEEIHLSEEGKRIYSNMVQDFAARDSRKITTFPPAR